MIQNNFWIYIKKIPLYLLSQIPHLTQLFFLGLRACRILGPWPGIEPVPPAVDGGVLLGHGGCQGCCLSLAGWHFRRYFKPFRYLLMVLTIREWALWNVTFPWLSCPYLSFQLWKKTAQLLCGMWDLPREGMELEFLAWSGAFFTTEPPEKPWVSFFLSI